MKNTISTVISPSCYIVCLHRGENLTFMIIFNHCLFHKNVIIWWGKFLSYHFSPTTFCFTELTFSHYFTYSPPVMYSFFFFFFSSFFIFHMAMMYLQRSHKWRKRRQQPPCWRQQQLWGRRRNHHHHCHQCRHIYQQFLLPEEDLPPCLLSPFPTGRIYKKGKMKEEREEDFKPFKKQKKLGACWFPERKLVVW